MRTVPSGRHVGKCEERDLTLARLFPKAGAKLQELRRRLNEIPGVDFAEEDLDGKPKFPLTALQSPAALQRFKDTFRWVIDTVRSS